jgi:hypothetical protein
MEINLLARGLLSYLNLMYLIFRKKGNSGIHPTVQSQREHYITEVSCTGPSFRMKYVRILTYKIRPVVIEPKGLYSS